MPGRRTARKSRRRTAGRVSRRVSRRSAKKSGRVTRGSARRVSRRARRNTRRNVRRVRRSVRRMRGGTKFAAPTDTAAAVDVDGRDQVVDGTETVMLAKLSDITYNGETYGAYPFLHTSLLSEARQVFLNAQLKEAVDGFIIKAVEEGKIVPPGSEPGNHIPIMGFTPGKIPEVTAMLLNPPSQCSIYNAHPHIFLNLYDMKNAAPEYGNYGGRTQTLFTEEGVRNLEATSLNVETGKPDPFPQTTKEELLKHWFSPDYLSGPGAGSRAAIQRGPSIRNKQFSGQGRDKPTYGFVESGYKLHHTNPTCVGGFYWKKHDGILYMEDSTMAPGGNPGEPGLLIEPEQGIKTAGIDGVSVFAPPAKEPVKADKVFLLDGTRKLLISGDIIIEGEDGTPQFLLRLFSNLVHGLPWANPVTNQFQAFFYKLIKNGGDHVNLSSTLDF
jgi:hypothetical protein